MPAQYKGCLTV